jgi:hypothetical protein
MLYSLIIVLFKNKNLKTPETMKKSILLTIIMIVLALGLLAQKHKAGKVNPAEKSLSNKELRGIFEKLPKVGFESRNYSMSDSDGQEIEVIKTIMHGHQLCLWRSPGWLNLNYDSNSRDDYANFFYRGRDVDSETIFYFKGKKILKDDVAICPPTEMDGGYIIENSPSLIMSSIELGNNSFLVTKSPRDYWGEHSGFYMNGKKIFSFIETKKDIPYGVSAMRIWEKKIIILLTKRSSDRIYLIFNPEKNLITYPRGMKKNKITKN